MVFHSQILRFRQAENYDDEVSFHVDDADIRHNSNKWVGALTAAQELPLQEISYRKRIVLLSYNIKKVKNDNQQNVNPKHENI